MTKFERIARKVAEQLGFTSTDDFIFGPESRKGDDCYEDDGNLHIEKKGEWACFSIGQDLSYKAWNEKVREIMSKLGLEKMVSARCLRERDEDEDEECPHCGGRLH